MENNTQNMYPVPKYRYNSTCPYCGHVNANTCEPSVYGVVVVCDNEYGGCDKPYVITVEITATVTSLAIEGYLSEAYEAELAAEAEQLRSDQYDEYMQDRLEHVGEYVKVTR